MHQELGSHPPTMEAGRSCDAYGLFEGHDIQQADAKRAYTQAYLTNPQGIPTYVLLPEDQWPQKWKDDKMRKPMCRLDKALYGHKNSGVYWNRYCDEVCKDCGFLPVGQHWPSCYWNERKKTLMIVQLVADVTRSLQRHSRRKVMKL